MTARQYLGCVGLLAAFFACVTQGCTKPPTLPKSYDAAAAVAKARDAGKLSCKDGRGACDVYAAAVEAGFLKHDDHADLACAQVAGVCDVLDPGAAGAPSR